MKNIYRLLWAVLFWLCTFISNAQNIDTASIEKNEMGTISFARVTNAKLSDGINFLKTELHATGNDSFALVKKVKDELEMLHLRYQQYYRGIKVENAEYVIHGRGESIQTMNGDFQIVNITSVIPALSEQEALSDALNYVNAKEYKWQDSVSENFIKQINNNPKATYYPKGELVIERDYLKGGKNLLLSWKFSIFSSVPNNVQLVYIDANTGEIVNTTPQMLDTNTPLTAQTRYSNTLNITGDTFAGGFRLQETRNGVTIQTMNLQNTNNYANAIDFANTNANFTNGNWAGFANNQQALDAHWGAENVLDFWRTVFNRNSLDGGGIRILGYVHFSPNGASWSNAQWVAGVNNRFMQYGDGDATTFNPLTALDICAHEMGHGINEFTANLTAGNQESGALNEGFSDIWAACIERWAAPGKQTWLIGEEIFRVTTHNCIRNLQNPKSTTAWEGKHPDTYQGTYWDNNGEPHNNSTVLSHWFYLLAQGGSGTNDKNNTYSISAIGIDKAQRIAWRTESVYLTPTANYAAARTASIQAATDLYCANSPEVVAVTNAWYAAGVGAAYSGSILSVSGAASFCTTATYSLTNQPTGITSLVWSTDNVNIASINNTSGLATKTGDGFVNIQANVTGTAGCATTVIKSVGVGNPVANNITIWSSKTNTTIGSPVGFVAGYPTMNRCQIQSTLWQSSLSANIASGDYECAADNGTSKNIFFQTTGTAYVQAKIQNACGWSNWSNPVPIQVGSGFSYMIAPNPATSIVTIAQKDNSNIDITEIKVFDNLGNLRKKSKYGAGTKQAQINVSDLQTGLYFIEITSRQSNEKQQLVIQK
ncbi:MAG: M4 family metallopeptidase [Agriterribacter sp.]